jgi:hypothetical protein
MGLSNVAVEQFRDQFTNIYQAMNRRLAGTVTEIRGVVGKAYVFKLAGKIILHDRGAFHSVIPSQAVGYVPKSVVLLDKIALVPSDIFEQAQVNASERANLAKSAAYAIQRYEDQFIINALDASGAGTIIDNGTNLNKEKLLEAQFRLDEENVPMAGRHLTAHASQKKSLLEEEEITSTDYNTIRALVRGEIDSFLGFKFHFFGKMDEGGIPKTGDIRTAFAWHEDAVGMAYGINPTVTVDWEPHFQSYIVVPKVRAGAVALQNDGIVKINCDENVTPEV